VNAFVVEAEGEKQVGYIRSPLSTITVGSAVLKGFLGAGYNRNYIGIISNSFKNEQIYSLRRMIENESQSKEKV
jgi:hypothetical protein